MSNTKNTKNTKEYFCFIDQDTGTVLGTNIKLVRVVADDIDFEAMDRLICDQLTDKDRMWIAEYYGFDLTSYSIEEAKHDLREGDTAVTKSLLGGLGCDVIIK